MRRGFTLIELLVVVAVIAILAAIAVPNFLEAQVRAKIARAKADMRSIDLAIQSYIVDHNKQPVALTPWNKSTDNFEAVWWGFCSTALTTPVAYIGTLPTMPFTDKGILEIWEDLGGTRNNQPYTWIAFTIQLAGYHVGKAYCNNKYTDQHWEIIRNTPITQEFHDLVRKSRYVIYTCGPDGLDTTTYRAPIIYDASNGTTSRGDIHRFGQGEPLRLSKEMLATSPYNEPNPQY